MRTGIKLILLSSIFALLSGCIYTNSTTGTPCSQQCYKTTYRVHGRNYKILKSGAHYNATGVASWYGRDFQRKHTSSGERYNMYSMTAAHKSLPLNTYVVVTNLTNGKKVVVKVNDRGPFVSNRLIDLSYAAAKKLGMVGRGTAQVNIKAIRQV